MKYGYKKIQKLYDKYNKRLLDVLEDVVMIHIKNGNGYLSFRLFIYDIAIEDSYRVEIYGKRIFSSNLTEMLNNKRLILESFNKNLIFNYDLNLLRYGKFVSGNLILYRFETELFG